MSFTSVQTWAAKQAVSWFNKKYDSNASLDYFRYSFPNTFTLRELYLPDEGGDTLIYTQKLNFSFTGFYSNTLSSNDIDIEKLRFYWLTKQGESQSNFNKFLAKFDTGDTTTPSQPFGLEIGNLEISDGIFRYENLNCDTCSRYWLKDLQMEIGGFDLNGSYVEADIRQFQVKERYSLDVYQLEAKAGYLEDRLYIEDLELKTSRSYVQGDIVLEYPDISAFSDFVNKVTIDADLAEETLINSEEIRFFAAQFPDFDTFGIGGKINGTVSDLQTRNLIIEIGEKTRLRGDIAIKDPTKADSLFIEAEDLMINTIPEDIHYIYGLFSDSVLPPVINDLGDINFSGGFKGFLNDFKAKGTLTTEAGEVEADLLFRNPEGSSTNMVYKGKVDLEQVNLGLLLQDTAFGMVSTRLEIDGKGLDPVSMNTRLDGKVPLFEYNQYAYTGISVHGRIIQGEFKGEFEIDDPNLQFEFNGNASFEKDTSSYNFIARIEKADLHALNFVEDSIANITSEMDIDFIALDYNRWQGSIKITNTTVENKRNFYFFEDVIITADGLDTNSTLAIQSDIVEGEITGNYTLSGIGQAFKHHVGKFFKTAKGIPPPPPAQNFDFNITIKNTQILTEIFIPALDIEPNSTITGNYAAGTGKLNIDVNSPGFSFRKTEVSGINLQYEGTDKKSQLGFGIGSVKLASGFEIDSINLGNYYYRDTLFYNLRWVLRDSIDSKASIYGYAIQRDSVTFEFGIDSSLFNVGFQEFLIREGNQIVLDTGGVHIEDLIIANEERRIVINGNISDNPNEILRLNLEGFGLELANYFIGSPNARFNGELYGDVILSQVLGGSPRFAADLRIDSLEMNNTLLGDFSLKSDWTYEEDTISLIAKLQLGELNTLLAEGYYQPDSLGGINFDIAFDRFRLAALNPLSSGIAENVRGYVNGKMQIRGNTGNPEITGDLTLPKVAFTISFLQTDYNLTGEPRIRILKDRITFPDLTLRDSKYGTEGRLTGSITHDNFKDFNLDLNIAANELLVLNTEASTDDAYYGTAFVSGDISLTGSPDELVIKADVATQRDTRFNIPLDAATNVSKSDFVVFVNPNNPDSLQEKQTNGLNLNKGITLDFNIEVNRSSEVQIIIDRAAGTKLTAFGDGNIRLRIAPFQDMEMYGTYTVFDGEFLFSLQNLVRRKFTVQRGGTVTWNGDPLNALVNITAEYSTRADPSVLVSEYSGGRTLVYIYLTLSGYLTNPDITFDIDAPRANSAVQTVIANRLSEEDRMNQQVFSLLAFNSFAPDQGIGGSAVGAGTGNGWDILANQASNWLNQVTGDYEVTLNYQGAATTGSTDEAEVISQEEVEVGVSKRFFNDRVSINSSLGVAVGNNQRTNQIAGDFEIEYDITPDGRLRAKVFNRSIQDQYALADQNYQQGIGIFYRIDFNHWGEFFYKLFNPVSSSQKEQQEKGARREEVPGPQDEELDKVRDKENEPAGEKEKTTTDEENGNK